MTTPIRLERARRKANAIMPPSVTPIKNIRFLRENHRNNGLDGSDSVSSSDGSVASVDDNLAVSAYLLDVDSIATSSPLSLDIHKNTPLWYETGNQEVKEEEVREQDRQSQNKSKNDGRMYRHKVKGSTSRIVKNNVGKRSENEEIDEDEAYVRWKAWKFATRKVQRAWRIKLNRLKLRRFLKRKKARKNRKFIHQPKIPKLYDIVTSPTEDRDKLWKELQIERFPFLLPLLTSPRKAADAVSFLQQREKVLMNIRKRK